MSRLSYGRKLRMFKEAIASWLAKQIPKSEHTMPKVQAAARMVTEAAENGDPDDLRGWACCRRSTVIMCESLVRRANHIIGESEGLRGTNYRLDLCRYQQGCWRL
jgi:hypothetical protein